MMKTSDTVPAMNGAGFLNSEFGVLRKVALCRPVHYDWAADNEIVVQARMAGLSPDQAQAMEEHQGLATTLEEAGVSCTFLEPDPYLPMQTFTRDSAVMTPWGLLICQMAGVERRGEWGPVIDMAANLNIPIWHRITAGPLEGGDIQILRPGEVLIGVNEVRTSSAAAGQLAAWFESEGWAAKLIRFPKHFLHLDTLFCSLNSDLALCATEILNRADVDWLAARFRLIPIDYRGVMNMACNVTALGNDRVLSAARHNDLNDRMVSEGLSVFAPPLEQFVVEGGSVHCLTMPLSRDTVAINA